jgi:hypothetical protein
VIHFVASVEQAVSLGIFTFFLIPSFFRSAGDKRSTNRRHEFGQSSSCVSFFSFSNFSSCPSFLANSLTVPPPPAMRSSLCARTAKFTVDRCPTVRIYLFAWYTLILTFFQARWRRDARNKMHKRSAISVCVSFSCLSPF